MAQNKEILANSLRKSKVLGRLAAMDPNYTIPNQSRSSD